MLGRARSKITKGITMKSQWIVACLSLTLLGSTSAFAGDKEATIASAESIPIAAYGMLISSDLMT